MTFKGGAGWLKRKNNLQTVQEWKQILPNQDHLSAYPKPLLFYNFML